MENMPNEIVELIFNFLPKENLAALRNVNSRFRRIVDNICNFDYNRLVKENTRADSENMLELACRSGHFLLIKKLLNCPSDKSHKSHKLSEQLFNDLCDVNAALCIQLLFKNCWELRISENVYASALIYACKNGSFEIIRQFVLQTNYLLSENYDGGGMNNTTMLTKILLQRDSKMLLKIGDLLRTLKNMFGYGDSPVIDWEFAIDLAYDVPDLTYGIRRIDLIKIAIIDNDTDLSDLIDKIAYFEDLGALKFIKKCIDAENIADVFDLGDLYLKIGVSILDKKTVIERLRKFFSAKIDTENYFTYAIESTTDENVAIFVYDNLSDHSGDNDPNNVAAIACQFGKLAFFNHLIENYDVSELNGCLEYACSNRDNENCREIMRILIRRGADECGCGAGLDEH